MYFIGTWILGVVDVVVIALGLLHSLAGFHDGFCAFGVLRVKDNYGVGVRGLGV